MSIVAIVAIAFFALLILGCPIVFVILSTNLLPGLIDTTFIGNAQYIVRNIISCADSTALLAPPMFTLAGIIMSQGGIAKRIYNVFMYIVGKLPAGMPCAVVLTCLFYGCISGSGVATAAAVGSMTIPILLELGYDKAFVGVIVSASAGLGVIIPPSTPYILYGLATNTSIGSLFIAGIIPGCVLAFFLCMYAIIYCKRHGEDRERIDKAVDELRAKGFLKVLKDSFWALLTPVILLGGLYSGAVTVTEVAVISVVYALFVSAVIYRGTNFIGMCKMFVSASRASAPLNIMIVSAMVMGRIFTALQIPALVSNFLIGTFNTKFGVLIVVNIILLLIGMVMDTGPAILIFAPMLLPICSVMNVSPIHMGIFMTINMAIGFVSPPFGQTLFITGPLIGIDAMQIGKKSFPCIG
ncbi:MAG: TRAP transporter large permease, partial [Lachnospiraceae bacterium]|nr:TRAP transporter large permease [Candidatus Minthocola equi]